LSDGRLLGEFVHTADPAAFEQLVRRHGAMVLGVCRRVVGDRHAAEDAFQAVWLVLARRAAVVRPREYVGNWLFGVAYRTALKARGTLARRYAREKQVTTMRHPEAPATAAAWADVAPVIDAELARLPDDLRLPVVLCDLEGRPQRDAARHLGLPVTTLVNRLMRARRALAKRLTDRGIALSGGALAGVLGTHASAQAVPHALAAAAVAGATAGAAPAAAVHLSEGVLRMMVLSKLKPVLASLSAATVLALGVGTAVVPIALGQDPPGAKQPLAHVTGLDDDAFLRRACDTIRGTPATELERALFRLDPDSKKRAKVVEWLLSERSPVAVLPRDDRAVITEWLLQADGSVRAVDLTTVNKGIDWLRVHQDGKVNINDWLVQPLPNEAWKQVLLDPTSGGPADGWRSWRDDLLPYVQQPTEQSKPTIDEKKADAAKAQAELDKARVELADQRLKLKDAEAARKRAEGSVNKLDVDLAQIDLEVARARVAQFQGQLDRLMKVQAKPADPKEKPKQKAEAVERAVDRLLLDQAHRLEAYENEYRAKLHNAAHPDDAAFLYRVLVEALNMPPTALEYRYFSEDKDPKKREKLIDLLLKDPKVAKTVGPDWKNKRLGLPAPLHVEVVLDDVGLMLSEANKVKVRTADPFAKLLDQVLDGKRSDEQVADAICLATVGRFPTESEQKMALAAVASAKDKRAAWSQVVHVLAGTKEAQAHAEALKKK